MRRAINEVKGTFARGKPMEYLRFKRLMASLSEKEKEQLTDFIINTYNAIDYTEAARYFGGYENMLIAMHGSVD